MGYRAEHFYYETRNKARSEKLAGQGIHHARQIMRINVLAFLPSVFEFVQEGKRFVNKLFNLCPGAHRVFFC